MSKTRANRVLLHVVIYPPAAGRTNYVVVGRCPNPSCDGEHFHRLSELTADPVTRTAPCGTTYKISLPVAPGRIR